MPLSLLEDVLDSLVTAVVRLDALLRVEYLNPAAADVLETSPRQAQGRKLRDLLPADEALAGFVERARARREPLAVAELALVTGLPPGRRRTVACEVQPLDGGGVQIELHVLERRQLVAEETSLWQHQQAQRRLLQALAHEIKNPLSGLRGAAQLLAAEGDGRQREYLDVMLRETDRLRELVDALLGPARAPRLAPVNIHAVLEHVRAVMQPGLPANLDWQRDYDPSLPELEADADQLTQVFLNLASNAVEALAGRRDARVIVRSRAERQYTLGGRLHRTALRVDIEDNGPGVAEHLRETLFLPLISGRADGSGLGLAIAQDIVQRHGGLIELRGEPGRTVFAVILPLTRNGNDNE